MHADPGRNRLHNASATISGGMSTAIDSESTQTETAVEHHDCTKKRCAGEGTPLGSRWVVRGWLFGREGVAWRAAAEEILLGRGGGLAGRGGVAVGVVGDHDDAV